MILPGGINRAYLATRPVDFRKGLVQSVLGHDPCNGAIYLFRSKRGDQLKCLVWDQTGLVLVYKKLEGGAFHRPKPADGVIRLPAHLLLSHRTRRDRQVLAVIQNES